MRRLGRIAAVGMVLAAAFGAGMLIDDDSARSPAPALGPSAAAGAAPIDEVRRELRRHYFRKVDAATLARPSIKAVIEALEDPYTDYLTSAEYEALREGTERRYSGIGLTVEPTRQGLSVTSALEGPAREAGIRAGDVIVFIDGKPASKLSFEASLTLIKGEEGTPVRLTVKRPGSGSIDFTVVRRTIDVPAVKSRVLGDRKGKGKLGYVRLLSFSNSSAQLVEKHTAALVRRGARGLVLDLRDNPGGLLDEAVETVSIFVAQGLVCTTRGLHHTPESYEVTGDVAFPKLPLVVLVNRGSASASEIVAAALADHRRAAVVGRRTYGKATVQTIRPLSNGRALKLTTATYATPAGADLARRGVRPRIRAVDDPLTPADEAVNAARRALLASV